MYESDSNQNNEKKKNMTKQTEMMEMWPYFFSRMSKRLSINNKTLDIARPNKCDKKKKTWIIHLTS